jgi:serine protease AprX
VWRHRPTALLGAVAGLAALAVVAPSASATPAAGTTEAAPAQRSDTTLTLSMEVEPGTPVPLALVRGRAAETFEDKHATGGGIDVALIDSGVTRVRGLDQAGKVLYGPDLSNEGGTAGLVNVDTYGHGTHLAGIIAGDDGDQVLGIAPDSRIVSVKVAGASGATDMAQVIAAIDWVVQHRTDNGMNIRVLNLSLGMPGVTTNVGDPLSAAVERAWHAGIVVVAAAGNRGNAAGGIDSPAVDPYVLAVGAIEQYDSWGSMDSIPAWTSGGNSFRQADVLAAGKSIMSLRAPGSTLDTTYPSAVVGERYFLGSGTSQAAAVVSGYAANLLSLNPRLSPDQVKYLFTRFADDMDPYGVLDGAGKIDARSMARRHWYASRAGVQQYAPAATGTAAELLQTNSASWSGGSWSGVSWSGGTWSGSAWPDTYWSSASWSSGSWSSASWSSASWSSASWSSASWSSASWSGVSWSGEGWR